MKEEGKFWGLCHPWKLVQTWLCSSCGVWEKRKKNEEQGFAEGKAGVRRRRRRRKGSFGVPLTRTRRRGRGRPARTGPRCGSRAAAAACGAPPASPRPWAPGPAPPSRCCSFPRPGLPPPPPGARGAGMTIGERGRLGWTLESSENGLGGGMDRGGQRWTGRDGQGWTASYRNGQGRMDRGGQRGREGSWPQAWPVPSPGQGAPPAVPSSRSLFASLTPAWDPRGGFAAFWDLAASLGCISPSLSAL